MDGLQFTVEMTKYIAWPIVVTIGVYALRNKVPKLLENIKSAKMGDKQIDFFESNQDMVPKTTESINLDHLIPNDLTGIRQNVEDNISSKLPVNATDEDKIKVLIKNLAQAQIVNAFEYIYNSIFGSQIRLLEFLSVQQEGKSEASTVSEFLATAKNNFPDTLKDKTFSEYMNFLLNFGLVENVGENWTITEKGRAFITYITAVQHDKNRML